MSDFPPTRAAALSRLAAFVPHAGRAYAEGRNHDTGRHDAVSQLSPYLRHRALTEQEVFAAVLDRHGPDDAAKFLSEVAWRTYWKGWLERRPSVWADYKTARHAAWNRVQSEDGLRARWETACAGETGIAGFDHWARELTTTGYLHNHARMWFASIWIFTLDLPWALGADFFLRHLLDGDAASNTLSWRWVAGRQTLGKPYVATRDNIRTYTGGRFAPGGLAEAPRLPDLPPHPDPLPAPKGDPWPTDGPVGVLMTDDDLCPADVLPAPDGWAALATLDASAGRSHLAVSPDVTAFTAALLRDASDRLPPGTPAPTPVADADSLVRWARHAGLRHVVCAYSPQGPARDVIEAARPALTAAGIGFAMRLRDWDATAWPAAAKGFFKFRPVIGALCELAQADGSRAA